ncbi:MAG: Mur ligase family protein [Acidimicrobiales bacterium]
MTALVAGAGLAAALVAGLRWLRVAQREHYLTGSVIRFAPRWWWAGGRNRALLTTAVLASVGAAAWPPVALWTAAAAVVGPVGLGLRGRTAPLRWTPRARRLAGGYVVACVVVALAGAAAWPPAAAVVALASPALMDAALALARPLEARLARTWVDQARRRLGEVAPTVVAITGSYGKTSTKEYVRHLLSGSFAVVASPASFNNALGLARTINGTLTAGTEVLVAEMGAYGRGEIASLCEWIPPTVSVITAVGPVHLERFGSLDAIADAKAEILAGAQVAVVNADQPHLGERVGHREGQRVIRCSTTDRDADVLAVRHGGEVVVEVSGDRIGAAPPQAFPMNLACAVGVGVALGVPLDRLGAALRTVPSVEHRRQFVRTAGGVTVIDDTYNANPAGAADALEALRAASGQRRVLVTPGLVELGRRQHAENAALARRAAGVVSDLVVVGRTNRRAIVQGALGGAAVVRLVPTREAAVAWVRQNLVAGDAVLYENDLPDHFP